MIKLATLLEINLQPGEESKMGNFLYRGTRDQIDLMKPYDDSSTRYSKMKGTIENLQTDHPENKRRTVGWEWNEMNTLEETNKSIRDVLSGRELQTLELVKKIIARLKERGYPKQAIVKYIMQYLNSLDEAIPFVMKTKPAVPGGLSQEPK